MIYKLIIGCVLLGMSLEFLLKPMDGEEIFEVEDEGLRLKIALSGEQTVQYSTRIIE